MTQGYTQTGTTSSGEPIITTSPDSAIGGGATMTLSSYQARMGMTAQIHEQTRYRSGSAGYSNYQQQTQAQPQTTPEEEEEAYQHAVEKGLVSQSQTQADPEAYLQFHASATSQFASLYPTSPSKQISIIQESGYKLTPTQKQDIYRPSATGQFAGLYKDPQKQADIIREAGYEPVLTGKSEWFPFQDATKPQPKKSTGQKISEKGMEFRKEAFEDPAYASKETPIYTGSSGTPQLDIFRVPAKVGEYIGYTAVGSIYSLTEEGGKGIKNIMGESFKWKPPSPQAVGKFGREQATEFFQSPADYIGTRGAIIGGAVLSVGKEEIKSFGGDPITYGVQTTAEMWGIGKGIKFVKKVYHRGMFELGKRGISPSKLLTAEAEIIQAGKKAKPIKSFETPAFKVKPASKRFVTKLDIADDLFKTDKKMVQIGGMADPFASEEISKQVVRAGRKSDIVHGGMGISKPFRKVVDVTKGEGGMLFGSPQISKDLSRVRGSRMFSDFDYWNPFTDFGKPIRFWPTGSAQAIYFREQMIETVPSKYSKISKKLGSGTSLTVAEKTSWMEYQASESVAGQWRALGYPTSELEVTYVGKIKKVRKLGVTPFHEFKRMATVYEYETVGGGKKLIKSIKPIKSRKAIGSREMAKPFPITPTIIAFRETGRVIPKAYPQARYSDYKGFFGGYAGVTRARGKRSRIDYPRMESVGMPRVSARMPSYAVPRVTPRRTPYETPYTPYPNYTEGFPVIAIPSYPRSDVVGKKKKKGWQFEIVQRKGYVPTVTSAVFQITGEAKTTISGLGLRPIPKGR